MLKDELAVTVDEWKEVKPDGSTVRRRIEFVAYDLDWAEGSDFRNQKIEVDAVGFEWGEIRLVTLDGLGARTAIKTLAYTESATVSHGYDEVISENIAVRLMDEISEIRTSEISEDEWANDAAEARGDEAYHLAADEGRL